MGLSVEARFSIPCANPQEIPDDIGRLTLCQWNIVEVPKLADGDKRRSQTFKTNSPVTQLPARASRARPPARKEHFFPANYCKGL
jgi:hypothetical protein